MKKVNKVIQKIESHYVGDDCVQIMIPYRNAVTILDQDGILFHSKTNSNYYINKYLEDKRRKQFPYSNIPYHYSTVGFLLKKVAYANQLFDFEKPYIIIGDGHISESFAVKDNNQALLVSSIMHFDKRTEHMTYDELLKFTEKSDVNGQTYYAFLDGTIPLPSDGNSLFPTEEEIYNHIKKQFVKNVKDFREYQQECHDTVSQYLIENPWFLDYIEQCIKNLDLSLINFNFSIGDKSLLIVRINSGNITIQCIDVKFIRKDDFEVNIYDIPVNTYTLEQLKFIPKIKFTKEPKIPLRINPSVTKQDIYEAKQLVKALRK